MSNPFNERLGEAYPWPIYRDRRGYVRWYQRALEAWWIITGRWSLFSAFEAGVLRGTAREYHRLIRNRAAVGEMAAWDKSQQQMLLATLTRTSPSQQNKAEEA